MTIGIYALKLKSTGEMWIQSSKDIERRFITHRSRLNTNKHSNPKLQAAWNQYGADAFEPVILQIANPGNNLSDLLKAQLEQHRTSATFNLDRGDLLKGRAGRKRGYRKPEDTTKPHAISIRVSNAMKVNLDSYRLPEEGDQALFDRILNQFFQSQ